MASDAAQVGRDAAPAQRARTGRGEHRHGTASVQAVEAGQPPQHLAELHRLQADAAHLVRHHGCSQILELLGHVVHDSLALAHQRHVDLEASDGLAVHQPELQPVVPARKHHSQAAPKLYASWQALQPVPYVHHPVRPQTLEDHRAVQVQTHGTVLPEHHAAVAVGQLAGGAPEEVRHAVQAAQHPGAQREALPPPLGHLQHATHFCKRRRDEHSELDPLSPKVAPQDGGEVDVAALADTVDAQRQPWLQLPPAEHEPEGCPGLPRKSEALAVGHRFQEFGDVLVQIHVHAHAASGKVLHKQLLCCTSRCGGRHQRLQNSHCVLATSTLANHAHAPS
mmetsp:Transcript_12203/g.33075  ORF Transcript_12203/g.33075 Transcript_12203/m.33075 type:complete len:337 (+) Transcript_12203:501-1511(+)